MTVCEYKRAGSRPITCAVYPAKTENAPVIMYIHGGALMSCNRHIMPKHERKMLTKAGFAVVSINYRLAPETKLPYIIEDVRDALEWTRGKGAELFGYDGTRLAVMGGSAGGYLTLMTGTFERKPKALVSFYGYGDLLGDWYCKPDPHYCKQPLVSAEEAMRGITGRVRTGGWRHHTYLRARQTGTWTSLVSGYDVDTEREKIVPYCPIMNISADYPPTMLLHCDNDHDVPYRQSVDMHAALKQKGIKTEFLTYHGFRHGFDSKKDDEQAIALIYKAIDFLKENL